MNYASVVFAGFAAISIGWYFVRGRKDFKGPPVPVDVSNTVKGQSIDVDGEADVGMIKGPEKATAKEQQI
jgi:hypothetical protein